MAATRLIAMHQNKGYTVSQSIGGRIDYATNGAKTEDGRHVSSYACDPNTAEQEFTLSKQEYLRITGRKNKGDILAYQIRQSFKPGEITPEEANAIGYETAMRFTKGNHAFVVATHVDRRHIHNHVVFNSTALDCTRKFRDFFLVGRALQRLSDEICLEHGLSVIKPRKYSERKNDASREKVKTSKQELDLLVDIQKKLREGKGAGYERWAKVFNLKQISKVLLFLEENGVRDYATLEKLAGDAGARFDEISERIKTCEQRLSEIAELRKHIINYSKTRDIYVAYRKSGYSKKFLEEHREEITLHKAAKEAFAKYPKGKIPRVKELNEEYATILAEKKKAYQEYRQIKKDMQDYLTAKKNIDMFLADDIEKLKAHEKEAPTK